MYIMYLTNNCSKIMLSSILSLGSSFPLQIYLTSVKNGQVEMEKMHRNRNVIGSRNEKWDGNRLYQVLGHLLSAVQSRL